MIDVYMDDKLTDVDTRADLQTKMTDRKFQSLPKKYDQLSFTSVNISQQPDGSVVFHQSAHAKRIQVLLKNCILLHFGLEDTKWLRSVTLV